MTVELRESGYGCRIGTVGPIVVSVFDSRPDLGLLGLLESVQRSHVAKHGKFSAISIISMPKLDPPSAEFRTGSAELSAKFQHALIGTALVILSTGAAAVAVRTFLAAYALISRQDRPQQTFRQIADGVQWLQGLDGQPPEVKLRATLTSEVEAFAAPTPARP